MQRERARESEGAPIWYAPPMHTEEDQERPYRPRKVYQEAAQGMEERHKKRSATHAALRSMNPILATH